MKDEHIDNLMTKLPLMDVDRPTTICQKSVQVNRYIDMLQKEDAYNLWLQRDAETDAGEAADETQETGTEEAKEEMQETYERMTAKQEKETGKGETL